MQRKTNDPAEMRLQIYPRRKAGQKKRDSSTGMAVVVTLEVLQGFADTPLVHAAKKLGISKTALKSACRTLGLERWPFRRAVDLLLVPEEPTAKSQTVSRKRKSGSTAPTPRARGASRQHGRSTKRQKKADKKAAPSQREESEENEEEEEDDEEGQGKERDTEDARVFDDESAHDLVVHDQDARGDLHQHGSDSEHELDSAQHGSEDWGSGTEEGDGVTSSNGEEGEGVTSSNGHGSSDKTSGDESAERSSCDEGCEVEVKGKANDLSWMAHGDGGLETFGSSHTLDDAPLRPLVIKVPPPPPPPAPRSQPREVPTPSPVSSSAAEDGKAREEQVIPAAGDNYHLHMSGDYVPSSDYYVPRNASTMAVIVAARDCEFLMSINNHPYGQHAQHHGVNALHFALQAYHQASGPPRTYAAPSWVANDDPSALADHCYSSAMCLVLERERTMREMALDSAWAVSHGAPALRPDGMMMKGDHSGMEVSGRIHPMVHSFPMGFHHESHLMPAVSHALHSRMMPNPCGPNP